MDEIVQQIVQRTGIPEDKARQAVQIVASQLESRLPAPLASQVSRYLAASGGSGAGGPGGGGLGGAMKGLGGLMGS